LSCGICSDWSTLAFNYGCKADKNSIILDESAELTFTLIKAQSQVGALHAGLFFFLGGGQFLLGRPGFF
jgi:hypothetical protein